jgi:hypothetical protein
MGPFDVDPGWYEKRWYSPEPKRLAWPAPAAFATLAAVALAVLFTSHGHISTVSHRLSPPFARTQMVSDLSTTLGNQHSNNVCFDFGRELCPYGR